VTDDSLGFEPGPHDLRVQDTQWIYYVRAVRRGESLGAGGGGGDAGSDLGSLVVVAVLFVFAAVLGSVFRRLTNGRLRRWQQAQPWKVGVVRIQADRWGVTGAGQVVHRELVPGPEVPVVRMEELADRVRSGEFAGRPSGRRARVRA
jgi:hypothetical protein